MTSITFAEIRRRLSRLDPQRPDRAGRAEAAVAVVLALSGAGGADVLFIRRATHERDPWSGQMGLPGGRREAEDEDLLRTVRRETLEETGIALPPESLLGELDELAPATPVLPPVVVRPYVFGLAARPAVRASSEVDEVVWAPLAALPQHERTARVRVRGTELEVPAFVIGPHVVWGMTHRIIKPLLDLVL